MASGYLYRNFRFLPGSDVTMTMPVRRALLHWLWPTTLLLAACAHQPAAKPTATKSVEPANSAPAAPVAPAVAADAVLASDIGVDADPAATPAADPEPTPASAAVLPTPDLFVRIRGGFNLTDADERAVDQQLNWYANNPEYLERTF